jgi:hypothetical protein
LRNYQLLQNLPAPCSKQFEPHRKLQLSFEYRPVNIRIEKESLFVVKVSMLERVVRIITSESFKWYILLTEMIIRKLGTAR